MFPNKTQTDIFSNCRHHEPTSCVTLELSHHPARPPHCPLPASIKSDHNSSLNPYLGLPFCIHVQTLSHLLTVRAPAQSGRFPCCLVCACQLPISSGSDCKALPVSTAVLGPSTQKHNQPASPPALPLLPVPQAGEPRSGSTRTHSRANESEEWGR